MRKQILGSKLQMDALVKTVFNVICACPAEDGDDEVVYAYESEVIEDTMIVKWDTEDLTDIANIMLDTALYYRSQDKLLWEGITAEHKIEQPADNHFRILTTMDKYEKLAEDYFVYNNITELQYVAMVYPLSLKSNVNKVELLAVGLTEEQMEILPKQAKTQVKAQAINKKMTKIGNQVASTSKIVMNDVVNPLGKATAKVGATVVGGLGKTALDMALTASNEILRDAACFSLNELKQRDEVQTMKYSLNKLLGKTNKPQAKQSANNFTL